MIVVTSETVEKTLVGIVEDLIQDWGLDLEEALNRDTLMVADLEFTSVDIIQLCVAVEQHYGRKMGFQKLLMKDGSYVSDLSLGQMADFLVETMKGGDK